MTTRSAEKGSGNKRRRIRLAIFIVLILALLALVFELTRIYRPPNPIDIWVDQLIGRDYRSDGQDVSIDGVDLPVTPERQAYAVGDMTLIIPKIGTDHEINDGTSREALRYNPSLFEWADMPGEGDLNTSVAGHREGGVFLRLDRVGPGDMIYIVWRGRVYEYLFRERKVIEPTDWSVIARQGYPCVTLVTCTPIGIDDHRLVVTGELRKIADYEENFDFAASVALGAITP
jgi:LPXTG-site transpeptidase (sortase) family protein